MNTLPVLAVIGLSLMLPVSASAATMNAETKLHLRCGAAYLLIADDPEMNNTAEETASFKSMSSTLLTHADALLSELGYTEKEREFVGMQYAQEMDGILSNNFDLPFDPEVCPQLVSAIEAGSRDAEIDKVFTCAAGFMLTAQINKDEGKDKAAEQLAAVGNRLADRGEALMIEAGLSEEERYELGKAFGADAAKKIYAGEDLKYDWETCAALDYQ